MNITEEQQEIKKEFQLERVILFSDAVFAIIITIMVIDIKLPEEARHFNRNELQHAFLGLMVKLLAYGGSFFIVASFWIRHLKIFSFLRDYNVYLLLFNLLFLFFVSLFPFAVSLITGATPSSLLFSWGVNIYIGIILSTMMSQTLLMYYLVKNKTKICINNNAMEAAFKWKAQRINLYLVPALVAVIFLFNFMGVPPTYSLWVVVSLGVINGRLKKRYYPKNDALVSY